MARIDDFRLRDYIGSDSLSKQEQQTRFDLTQKALAAWREAGGQGALGDFYSWLLEDGTGPAAGEGLRA